MQHKKFAVSNISWLKGTKEFPNFLKNLKARGAVGTELALSCLFHEPVSIAASEMDFLTKNILLNDLTLVSLHSLTFTRPDLELFGSSLIRNDLFDYLRRYADLARSLGCKNLVFGSPSTRKTFGKSREELDETFVTFLLKLDDYLDGIHFNIEPLATVYCDYLNSFSECVSIVETGGFKNVFVQLDARTIIESNEVVEEVFRYPHLIKHVHASNPGMSVPGDPYSDVHRLVNLNLTQINYNGFITAEVKKKCNEEPSLLLSQISNSMQELYNE